MKPASKTKAKAKVDAAKPKAKTARPPRQKMPRTSDEMKRWCAMLGGEMSSWPHVTAKSMFGLLAFYRKGKVFAGLPATRGICSPNAIILKIKTMTTELSRRVDEISILEAGSKTRAKEWYSFEIRSEEDLRDGHWWRNHVYALAK
jgi:hypothetical protein